MRKVNKVIAAKLCRLVSFLHQAGEEFEKIAKKIEDKNIKMSVRTVVLETKQYKQELNSQLQCLRMKSVNSVDIIDGIDPGEVLKNNNLNEINTTDKEIIDLCCKNEINFERAYRNILNEYFPYHGLRKMLIYQLNGIKCAFMQLKLLRSVGWVYEDVYSLKAQ